MIAKLIFICILKAVLSSKISMTFLSFTKSKINHNN